MKKSYTIGRDTACDIIISDSTDVISRVHATIKVVGRGKYTIVDQSRNGTYINGIRMSSNEEIPVTRKDIISLAHVRNFDWDLIPEESNKNLYLYGGIALGVIIIAGLLILLMRPAPEQPIKQEVIENNEQVDEPKDDKTPTDSVKKDNPKQDEESESKKDKEQPASKDKDTKDKNQKEQPNKDNKKDKGEQPKDKKETPKSEAEETKPEENTPDALL